MHTVRSSGRWGECLTRKGVSDQGGGSAQGGVWWGGVCPSACWDTHPHYEQNDRHLWKHNLSKTTVADGNNET